MQMDFKKKVVIITGGSGGLGKAFAKKFLEKGSKVCICDINEETGKEIVNELGKKFGSSNIIFSRCDVTKDEEFEATFETCKASLGEANVLINNAGIAGGGWQKVLDINLNATVRGTNLAIKKMGKQYGGNGGNVVNIGSITGLGTYTVASFYSASKAAVIHFTRSIGDDFYYRHTGVMVQCLNPSFVETPIISTGFGTSLDKPTVPKNELIEMQQKYFDALPRLRPEDISDAIIVLIQEGKKGAAMVIELNKPLYYVDAPLELIPTK